MGFFNKIKNMFKGTEKKEEVIVQETEQVIEKEESSDDKSTKVVEKSNKVTEEVKKSVKVYEKGLTKSRDGFVSKLAGLTNKYKKVTDEYFDDIITVFGHTPTMSYDNTIKGKIKDGVSKFLFAQTRRSPMVLPMIMEV